MPTQAPIDRELFLKALTERFPEVAVRIGELESGLLHPEMGVVSDATRSAIEAGNWQAVAAHFCFVSEVFAAGNEAVRNAVYVSYLENVLLGETAAQFLSARTMLPPVLADAMIQLEAHFERLTRANRNNA